MSILISSAEGSKDLYADISKRPGHPEVELVTYGEMPFSDFMIPFNGPKGEPLVIGVEFKKLGDLLGCIQSGRFSGVQAPGLSDTFDLTILLIEGTWRMNHQTGILETLKYKLGWKSVSTGPRKWMYRELNRWLLIMEIVGGISIWHTPDRDETVQTLIDLHELGKKKWDDHSTVRMQSSVTTDQLRYKTLPDGSRRMQFKEPTLLERLLIQLPGLGVDRTRAAAKHFKTAGNLGDTWRDEKLWKGMQGIGKGIAKQIVAAIDKEEA